ncbi:MAG: spore maturation protein [Magnetococcales bacterium]|nr:spore maturation protein [Magnetococcales bacterium]
MNAIFYLLVLGAFVAAALAQGGWNGQGAAPMAALNIAMVESANGAVTLALGMVGMMALFLGLMKVVEAGGGLAMLARLIRPLMVRLFPQVPGDHPAMGAMILNIAANVLGLGNAATPFGIRAMQELDTLNPHPGTATNAMALFLAINTASVTLLPTGVIALRAAAGSADPAAVLPTTLFATVCSTAVAILMALWLQRLFKAPATGSGAGAAPAVAAGAVENPAELRAVARGYPLGVSLLALGGLLALVPLTIVHGARISHWLLPGFMLGLLTFGVLRRVRIYEVFVEGAREGFDVALRIIPYLVAILVAVGLFRASGALGVLVDALDGVTAPLGLPGAALPMVLLRPLSGSGAYGVMSAIIQDPAIGPDSYVGMLVCTIQGSTETTFYVLAVYAGAVRVRNLRHALTAALISDLVGVVASVAICRYLYG